MSGKADVKRILRQAERAGCQVTLTKRSHWRIVTPAGRPVFSAGTPSDHRGLRNLAADLRRLGVPIEF